MCRDKKGSKIKAFLEKGRIRVDKFQLIIKGQDEKTFTDFIYAVVGLVRR